MPRFILGLESSCDETAAAVVEDAVHVRSNVIATQHELHAKYDGVVPEIASRAHIERLVPVIDQALADAGIGFADLDGIAVANRPGLIGSLLVGLSAAKALAWALDKPLIGVDHIHAHLYAGLLEEPGAPLAEQLPALGLVVSGGHSTIARIDAPFEVSVLGRTIDDAIGEAYDKAATLIGLPYPGGPELDRLAGEGDDRAHDLPVSLLGRDSLDFSFSGLKTSFLYLVCGRPERGASVKLSTVQPDLTDQQRADLAASFQRAAVTAVMKKIARARTEHPDLRTLLVGGGVSANSRLRRELLALEGIDVRLPAMEHCLDNAAMIAGLGAVRLAHGERSGFELAAAAR